MVRMLCSSVGQLDEDDPDVARHGQQHLAEALGLAFFLAGMNCSLSSLVRPSTSSATGAPELSISSAW
jgi:hypothetical protein